MSNLNYELAKKAVFLMHAHLYNFNAFPLDMEYEGKLYDLGPLIDALVNIREVKSNE